MSKEIKMPVFDLTDKVAIVTGGTKGLGYAIAATFAGFGCNVVITSRTPADCERCATEINEKYTTNGMVIGVAADATKQPDIDMVIGAAIDAFGKLDILINNAGINGKTGRILSDEQSEENFDKVLSNNLRGVFLFSKAAARQMVKQGHGGKIINTASVAGLTGGVGTAPYSASKAGVISLTKTMAIEFAQYGITVNAICPGSIITPLNEGILSNPEIKTKMEEKTAVKRLGTVEEIAGPVLALASDCFGFMTGTYLLLDGGQTIGS